MKIIERDGVIELCDFQIEFDIKVVLELMDCHSDSPILEEVMEEYQELEPLVYEMLQPKGLIKFGEVPEEIAEIISLKERRTAYVMTTVGKRVSEYSTAMFAKGDYLKGMLVDSMADSYLFQMESALQDQLRVACAERHVGVKTRLEAPHDIPMEMQKVMHEQTKAYEMLGIGITSGYMFDPVKTSCQILILTDDEQEFRTQHDCRKCSAIHCKLRNIPPSQVMVVENDKKYTISCAENQNIWDALVANHTYFSAVCGGKGLCGKCKIRLLEGQLEITSSDEKKFSKEELQAGYRLACMAYPKEDCSIALALNNESEFSIVSDASHMKVASEGVDDRTVAGKQVMNNQGRDTKNQLDYEFGIAIDIGTTTIAWNLVGEQTRSVLASYGAINRQRSFGADVISRIQASNDGKSKELQQSVREDLLEGIQGLLGDSGIRPDQIRQVAIGGNTTMGHLLLGYSCENLGTVPFTPVNIKTVREPFEKIFGSDLLDCETVILPGISTFVGGDIVSGLYYCDYSTDEKVSLLVDLGTNGEMAIGNKDRILVTSTAAGPAFEGGNITWGMGSVRGAISNVSIEEGKVTIQTIGDAPPIGLCGTGVIEIAAELVKEEYVDETGRLDEECFRDGFQVAQTVSGEKILFTQKDIREIQLAKAAVRAGIETLLLRYGVTYDQVECVYLAGGFGFHIDTRKAVQIGMIPEELEDRIKTVGNSSLGGAIRYLTDGNGDETLTGIVNKSLEISLSTDKDFNEFYMEHMFFE